MKRFLLFSFLSLFCLDVSAQSWIPLGNELNGTTAGDGFGSYISISADGKTVAEGAPNISIGGNKSGQVQVFTYNGTIWLQKGGDIYGESGYDHSSVVSLSADGNTVAIGAPGQGSPGKVRIFDFDGANWVQRGATILGQGNMENTWIVSISGDGLRVAISYLGFSSNMGQVRVFEWSGNSWDQLGSDVSGSVLDDKFGFSMSLSSDGNTFVTGTPYAASLSQENGEVRIFEFDGTDWISKGNAILGEQTTGELGASVDISADGNTIIAGEYGFESNGSQLGRARIFTWNGSSWIPKGAPILGIGNFDNTGRKVIINSTGDIVATKGLFNNDTASGNVRMFKFNGTNWMPLGQTIVSPNGYASGIGYGMDFSDTGNIISIGNAQGMTYTGQVKVYKIHDGLKISENPFKRISIYPSPTQGEFTINLGDEYTDLRIQISNILGQIISTQNYIFTKIIETKIVGSSGIYLVKLSTVNGESKTFKILKE